ncbi:efflux RND transporter permease subunit [Candidatus Albibeggiatoa sp. nov. NOAA]|uniref:efflux RND transporter permease subunit n=1 Tax=Candidatus Albibeggiatoa sp. nov. NOAA TaxID=3162724 RepID=UPI0032F99161|nr:efflux RND transporter permease subunit [Thiotrichaceae bacterium]
MHRIEMAFSQWVVRWRWLLLILMPMLVMLAASGGRYLEFTNNYRVFFSEENPQLQAFDALENTYTKNDNVLIVLAPKDGNVFTNDTLDAVVWATEQAWQTPFSIRVDSISNFQYTYADGDELIVQDLVENPKQLTQAELDKLKQIALDEPLLNGRLISPSAHVTSISITEQLPGINEAEETPQVVGFARDLVQQLEARYPNIDIYLNGLVVMNNAFQEASINDFQTLIPISFAAMLIMLALLLKGLSGTFATLLVIFMSILAAMGLGGFVGFPISPPSASAPTIILTIAIANSVHVLVSFYHEVRHGKDKFAAMSESLRVNIQPIFLTSLTTAIGFLSMNFSDAPPFRHLGNFVAFGVMTSFILSVTFLPALMLLLPVKSKRLNDGESNLMAKFGDFVVRQRHILLISMSFVVIVLISFIPRNELNDIFVHYFDERVEFRRHADFLDENIGGLYRIDYSLNAGESNGISRPEFLQQTEILTNWLREQPEVLHVNSLTDTMKRLNKNMHGDDPESYHLPENRELAAQYLLLYEMSLPFGLDLNDQIDVDKSATRLGITLRTLSTKQILALEQRIEQWMEQNTPDIKTTGSSPTLMFAHIGERNIKSMLLGTTIALVLISVILMFALRSWKMGLVSMLPNLAPAAMGFGIWGLFIGEVGLALSVVTGMTLGIVVDDTVHFLSKYLRARREKAATPAESVHYAFAHVGMALWITSVVLSVGFLILSLSSFSLNADMGLLTAIVIAFALLADFLLLPPLLMKLEGQSDEETISVRTAAESA